MNEPARAERRVLDVSGLPTYAFGNRSLMWWGTFGMILIESMVFILAVVTYFYLSERSYQWPPHGAAPVLTYGTINTLVLLASAIPNQWTKRAAEREDLRAVRIGLVVCLVFAAAFIVLRVFEFGALRTSWNESAYGSIVFALMTLHTIHLITDVIDTAVLTVLMFTGPLSGRRFVDVSENALYWWFVVGSWLIIYATVYLAPRVL
jgi:heme/copper-type cytochrome/quinol oxidase subunit 3